MAPTLSAPVTDSLRVRPWPDHVIDAVGIDPRSHYVEQFWLPTLGPSTTLLLRRIAGGLEEQPAGFELPLTDTARALGLGHMGGRHSPFVRALSRLCQFDLAQAHGEGELAVRRKVPPLNRRQVVRLPESMQAAHQAWQDAELAIPAHEQLRRRSRQLALSLLELGEDVEATERQLARWRFHPALCREATAWAWARHRQAREAAEAAS
jgi:hypothetical protein